MTSGVYKTSFEAKRGGRTIQQKIKNLKKTKQSPYTGA